MYVACYNWFMDKYVKQSIDSRRGALSASYEISAEMQKEVDALFGEMERLGEKCKDVGEFETEFRESPLNQKYLDLFTKVATKCQPKVVAPKVSGAEVAKMVAGGAAAGVMESVADDALRKVVPTRAAVNQEVTDAVRKTPVVGDVVDVAEKASYALHLSKLFGRKKK